MNEKIFPTEFAIEFAEQVKLADPRTAKNPLGGAYLQEGRFDVSKEEIMEIEQHATELYARLGAFQKISSVLSYEKAVIVYKNFMDLTEEQEEILKLIAELTPHWVKGEITETLLDLIKRDPKTAPAIAETILKALDTNGASYVGDSKVATGVVKKFVMELTGEEPS